jgi:hypothetical protein
MLQVLGSSDASSEDTDLNVEHCQMLLFFFHALALMQKKQILLLAATSLIEATEAVGRRPLRPVQTALLAKLVLLLEYLMRHLYEPPKELLDHVQSNVFRRGLSGFNAEPKHFAFKELKGSDKHNNEASLLVQV